MQAIGWRRILRCTQCLPCIFRSRLPNSNGPAGRRKACKFCENVFGMQMPVDPSGVEAHGNEGDPMSSVEMSGIAPGQYEVESCCHRREGRESFRRLMRLRGRSERRPFEPPPWQKFQERFPWPAERACRGAFGCAEARKRRRTNLAQVEAGWQLQVEAVRPGSYTVLIGDNGGFRYVAQMNAVGGKADGRELEVGSDAIALTIVVAEANSAVSGFAKLNGKAAPGVLWFWFPMIEVRVREQARAPAANRRRPTKQIPTEALFGRTCCRAHTRWSPLRGVDTGVGAARRDGAIPGRWRKGQRAGGRGKDRAQGPGGSAGEIRAAHGRIRKFNISKPDEKPFLAALNSSAGPRLLP